MRNLDPQAESLSGQLLIAQPSLLDPNFNRTVVLLSMHSQEEGAMGVVLNRPKGNTLGEECVDLQFSPIAGTPVYIGGPVGTEQFLLAAWRWPEEQGTFELHFGITQDKLMQLKAENPDIEARCFLGHAGWGAMQLEQEIQQSAWLVSTLRQDLLRIHPAEHLWKELICAIEPDFRIEAEAPDDPSLN